MEMTLTQPQRARLEALIEEGLDHRAIGYRLGITFTEAASWRNRVLTERLLPLDGRAAALAYGRRLVAAKVAAGEWVAAPVPAEGGRP